MQAVWTSRVVFCNVGCGTMQLRNPMQHNTRTNFRTQKSKHVHPARVPVECRNTHNCEPWVFVGLSVPHPAVEASKLYKGTPLVMRVQACFEITLSQMDVRGQTHLS